MTILFLILIILASVILGLIILVQNPKGGGLTGNVAGLGNQFMGVKQTTDVLEKGTWLFASIIGILCIVSVLFMGEAKTNSAIDRVNSGGVPSQTAPKAAPAATSTAPAAKADSNAK
ncbi:MAG TPA: preprotein translocase subunit SecG [Phnomibacter sp.]|nr:preprotein translocase subunit SecG [Phnomibacter sp.]